MNARREITWMVLPVVFLGLIGWVWRKRDAATVLSNEPFRLRVEKVTFVPVKPREAFEGYDTKALLTLGHSGATPKWWDEESTSYSSRDHGKVVAVSPTRKQKLSVVPRVTTPHQLENGEWQVEILAELAKVPASAGELRFVDSVMAYIPMGTSPRLAVDFRLRRQGQGTPVPIVDQHTSQKLEKVFVAPLSDGYPGARVKFWVRGEDPSYNSTLDLKDASGQVVTSNTELKVDRSAIGRDGQSRIFVCAAEVYGDEFKTPQASVDAIFYNGNEWPLRVHVPLRNSRSQYLFSPLTGPNCRLNSLTARQATPQERTNYVCDTVVSLDVVSLEPDTTVPHSWDVNLDAHIENRDGSRWTQNNLVTPSTPADSIYEFPTEVVDTGDEEKHSGKQVNYFVNLSTIAKSEGPLWFKDSIRLNDGQILSVKIQVRK